MINNKHLLSNGRPIQRVEIKGNYLFTLLDLLNPKSEFGRFKIEKDETLASLSNLSVLLKDGNYNPVMGGKGLWTRACELVVYRKDLTAPLGEKIIMIEHGKRYVISIPDIAIEFSGNSTKLRDVSGSAIVYDSVHLLKLTQTDKNMFTISPLVEVANLADRIKIIKLKAGWASPDADGFPAATQPPNVSEKDPNAKYYMLKPTYEKDATGWAGSPACVNADFSGSHHRVISLRGSPDFLAMVAIVGPQQVQVKKQDGKIIIEGSPEQIAEMTKRLQLLTK